MPIRVLQSLDIRLVYMTNGLIFTSLSSQNYETGPRIDKAEWWA